MYRAHVLSLAIALSAPLGLAQQLPSTYCTSGTSTNGCAPTIAANVPPNVANTYGCVITTSGMEGNKLGMSFYGVNNLGFTPTPFTPASSSWRCVAAPIQRMGPPANSGGSTGLCEGVLTLSWDAYQIAHPTALGNPWLAGAKVYVQTWCRDPLAPAGANLSNALEMTVSNAVVIPCDSSIPGMVLIPPGTFTMGRGNYPTWWYPTGGAEDLPAHDVSLSDCIWMSRFEVTQQEYESLMGVNPSWYVGVDRPVNNITWSEARAYCAALTAQRAASGGVPPGYEYRLPTEAEWERACRAGTTTPFSFGASLDCEDAAVYPCTFPLGTLPVGSYAPNALGLYDMHGNVEEWCLDTYAGYGAAPQTNPFVTGGTNKIRRGGSIIVELEYCHSARRGFASQDEASPFRGFRVVLGPVRQP